MQRLGERDGRLRRRRRLLRRRRVVSAAASLLYEEWHAREEWDCELRLDQAITATLCFSASRADTAEQRSPRGALGRGAAAFRRTTWRMPRIASTESMRPPASGLLLYIVTPAPA